MGACRYRPGLKLKKVLTNKLLVNLVKNKMSLTWNVKVTFQI